MPKPVFHDGSKNLIAKKLIALRKEHNLSQRGLAIKLQTMGYDVDKNVITRIETGKRYVSDIELFALCTYFRISSDELIGLGERNIEY